MRVWSKESGKSSKIFTKSKAASLLSSFNLEEVFISIPASFAFSLTTYKNPCFDLSGEVAKLIIKFALENKEKMHDFLFNINVPNISLNNVKDIKLTSQGRSEFNEDFDERQDAFGRKYYWLTGNKTIENAREDSDEKVLRDSCISFTPLHYDMTDYSALGMNTEKKDYKRYLEFIKYLKFKIEI